MRSPYCQSALTGKLEGGGRVYYLRRKGQTLPQEKRQPSKEGYFNCLMDGDVYLNWDGTSSILVSG